MPARVEGQAVSDVPDALLQTRICYSFLTMGPTLVQVLRTRYLCAWACKYAGVRVCVHVRKCVFGECTPINITDFSSMTASRFEPSFKAQESLLFAGIRGKQKV